MSKFEFIMMFVSVVVAFAMAELLMSWGRIIRNRQRVQQPWLLAGWSIWLLIIMTYHYLGFWEYQAYDFTRVAPMLLFLAAPIMMVLLTFTLMPEIRHYRTTNLENHFYLQKNWFLVMVIIFLLLSRASDPLLPDFAETWPQRMLGTVLVSLSVIWLLFTRSRRVHFGLMLFNVSYLLLVSFYLPVRGLTAF
ncbi:MAG: hypothetical protein Q8L06_11285 [Pseudohongiella sp.]|nr:hypothetical protein [Pseudohongiella sp.]